MDPQEIDITLDELENRLDRLRSLYEQYFLGIEKIEPGVARKDVDRRFWVLRRVHIRNTARRFRLQVLIQRYNTFQQHWARICREIENGTYTRHLIRAQKAFGDEPKTWAAKKRLGYFRKKSEADNGNAGGQEAAGEDLGAMLDSGEDLDAEAARAAESALAMAEARAREEARVRAPPSVSERPSPAAPRPAPPNTSPPLPRRRADLDLLDLDLDDGISQAPAAPRILATPQRTAGAAAKPAQPSMPLPRPPAPAAGAPNPQAPIRQPPAGQPPPIKRAPAPNSEQRAVAPAAAVRVAPPLPKVQALPSAAARPPSPERNPAPAVGANTQARVPLPRTAAVADPAKLPPAIVPTSAGLSEARLRQIHGELAAAKRQLNQADAVSLDALSKSLRESEKRISAQHPGRTVDFHVVVKDGKPVVKPIVRK